MFCNVYTLMNNYERIFLGIQNLKIALKNQTFLKYTQGFLSLFYVYNVRVIIENFELGIVFS